MSEPYWVALGGAQLDYKDAWSGATPYTVGDIVTHNGVTYLAVNPSLGSAPPAVVIPTTRAMCRLRRGSDQVISHGAETTLSWDVEDFDTDGMHESVTNPSRITIRTAGKYAFGAEAAFIANATGQRGVGILKAGAIYLAYSMAQAASSNQPVAGCNGIADLAVDDYLYAVAYQNSGGDLAVGAFAQYSPVFWAHRID